MKKILIVEDDKASVKLVAYRINEELETDVLVADNYATAVSMLESSKSEVSMVISGLVLPDAMNGEMVDWCAANRIPVIVMTASFDDDLRRKTTEKPIFDYIVKWDKEYADVLIRTVGRAIRNSQEAAMIVDDSAVFRKLVRGILESQLFRVYEAANGVEALDVLRAHPQVSLVVTDYDMPEMDGLELLKRIRKSHSVDNLAVIALSSESDTDVVPKFLKFGANDYVIKPFNKEEFVSRVNLNLDNIELIRHIRSVAHLDLNTGLYNRKYFYEMGKVLHSNAERNGYRIAVAALDVNGILPESAVPAVERQTGKLINTYLKRRSDVVARIAPGQFAVLTENQDSDDLYNLFAGIVKAAAASPVETDAGSVKIDPVAGIWTQMEPTFEGMVEKAMTLFEKARDVTDGEKVWVE